MRWFLLNTKALAQERQKSIEDESGGCTALTLLFEDPQHLVTETGDERSRMDP
jgi:hypothetical protein